MALIIVRRELQVKMKNVRNLPLPESFAEQYNIDKFADALR
jgi:hypothetical protein